MLFPTPEENKMIAGMLADCGGIEYDFHKTLSDGRVMKYHVKLTKTEVKSKKR